MDPDNPPYFCSSSPKFHSLGPSPDKSCPVLGGAEQGSAGGKGPVLDPQEHIPSLESAFRVVLRRAERPQLCTQDIGLQEKENF